MYGWYHWFFIASTLVCFPKAALQLFPTMSNTFRDSFYKILLTQPQSSWGFSETLSNPQTISLLFFMTSQCLLDIVDLTCYWPNQWTNKRILQLLLPSRHWWAQTHWLSPGTFLAHDAHLQRYQNFVAKIASTDSSFQRQLKSSFLQ